MECTNCGKKYKNKTTLNKHMNTCNKNYEKTLSLSINNINLDCNKFNIDEYLLNINSKITKLFEKSKYNENILQDRLLDCYIKKNEDVIKQSKKLKQLQMNIGKIWQITIGNYDKFTDLGEGNETGLDVKSDELMIIMEIKNRYNTDNASAKKSNFNKLTKFKNNNPLYKCIYAIINDKTEIGKEEKIIYNNLEITYLSGNKLLDFIFGNNKDIIIKNLLKQMENL
jgi:hypothetical protein